MLVAVLAACSPSSDPSRKSPVDAGLRGSGTPPNVLLVIFDDVGVDRVAAYGEHPNAPATPTLSGLASEGVLFRNVWAHPFCSATRAAVQTGRYARRSEIGYVLYSETDGPELPPSDTTIPEMLQLAPVHWDTSMVGKWHLGSRRSGLLETHPGRQGYAWYATSVKNLSSYSHWGRDLNGIVERSEGYPTTVQADDAIARTQAMVEPWFLTLSFNAAHAPLHVPPGNLGGPVPANPTPPDKFDAMLRAADAELGRVLGSMSPALRARTVVIAMGDNGTMADAARPPQDAEALKGTVYEGGVNVPLLISGPIVKTPGESDALVHAVDLFPTIADLAGVDLAKLPAPVDGRSLLPVLQDLSTPVHEYLVSELYQPNGPPPGDRNLRAVRGARYKLMVLTKGGKTRERLFDLQGRNDDGPDLLAAGSLSAEAQAALTELRAELARQLPVAPTDGGPRSKQR